MRIVAFFLMLFAAAPVWAAAPVPVPSKLSAHEKADVARVEAYLNAMKSIAAGFTQVSDSGEFRHGSLAIQRPGKMRVTYDPPEKDFLVADGESLRMWDSEIQQQSSVSLDSSLAGFILRDTIRLNGDVTLTRFARAPATMEVSLVATDDPANGELTLVFEDKPLQLRQWRVVDGQGRMTTVTLENTREGVSFPSGTFDFVAPNFGKSNKNGAKLP